jgi:hypothetical protein
MSCCGGQRSQAGAVGLNHAGMQSSSARHSVAFMQYVGRSGLTVVGPATGKRYRFDTPGAILAVELPDRASLAALPMLRQVAGP